MVSVFPGEVLLSHRLRALSAAVVVGASPTSSAALGMSDRGLGLLFVGSGPKPSVGHPLRAPGLPEECLTASLGPILQGAGLSRQSDIP